MVSGSKRCPINEFETEKSPHDDKIVERVTGGTQRATRPGSVFLTMGASLMNLKLKKMAHHGGCAYAFLGARGAFMNLVCTHTRVKYEA